VEALLAGGSVPWTLAFSQRLGRHVVATRDIQPGAHATPLVMRTAYLSVPSACRPGRLLFRQPGGISRHVRNLPSRPSATGYVTMYHTTVTRAGELVLRERAVAALPRDKFAARLCHGCFDELKGKWWSYSKVLFEVSVITLLSTTAPNPQCCHHT
jgi:hypothetical protein